MKVKNKLTGEIVKLVGYVKTGDDRIFFRFEDDKGTYKKEYNSLAELNAEWVDVPEEPKEYWHIDFDGSLMLTSDIKCDKTVFDKLKEIGNYFDTLEEAEKAVEKLKAWKRLKDNGISFEAKVIDRKWYLEPKAKPQQRTFNESHDLFKDVMLLFGGEE